MGVKAGPFRKKDFFLLHITEVSIKNICQKPQKSRRKVDETAAWLMSLLGKVDNGAELVEELNHQRDQQSGKTAAGPGEPVHLVDRLIDK